MFSFSLNFVCLGKYCLKCRFRLGREGTHWLTSTVIKCVCVVCFLRVFMCVISSNWAPGGQSNSAIDRRRAGLQILKKCYIRLPQGQTSQNPSAPFKNLKIAHDCIPVSLLRRVRQTEQRFDCVYWQKRHYIHISAMCISNVGVQVNISGYSLTVSIEM